MSDEPRAAAPPDRPSPLDEADDARLVRRARAGDEDAFAGLVERYGDPVLSLCYASTLDRSAAEELAQDVFVAAWRGLSRYRGDAAFSTWLFAIARNQCIDGSRRRRARPRTQPFEEHHEPAAATADVTVAAVLAAARDLSVPLRQALLLRDLQGLGYAEIAELQDVPVGTVRSRLAAARGFVADRLES